MAATNGHDPAADTASAQELDALLQGIFEPTLLEVAPGKTVEIRPLLLGQADALYAGGLGGAALQRFLMARCVYLAGRPLGELGADRIPVGLANKIVPLVMKANGMQQDTEAAGEGGEAGDPLP